MAFSALTLGRKLLLIYGLVLISLQREQSEQLLVFKKQTNQKKNNVSTSYFVYLLKGDFKTNKS